MKLSTCKLREPSEEEVPLLLAVSLVSPCMHPGSGGEKGLWFFQVSVQTGTGSNIHSFSLDTPSGSNDWKLPSPSEEIVVILGYLAIGLSSASFLLYKEERINKD